MVPVMRNRAVAAVVLAVAATGCSNLSGSAADRMAQWSKSSGASAVVSTLDGDARGVSAAIESGVAANVRTACGALSLHVRQFLSELPTPDPKVTADYDAAYQHLGAAANECYDGARGDSTLINRALADMAAGRQALAQADALRRKIIGS